MMMLTMMMTVMTMMTMHLATVGKTPSPVAFVGSSRANFLAAADRLHLKAIASVVVVTGHFQRYLCRGPSVCDMMQSCADPYDRKWALMSL